MLVNVYSRRWYSVIAHMLLQLVRFITTAHFLHTVTVIVFNCNFLSVQNLVRFSLACWRISYLLFFYYGSIPSFVKHIM